MKKFLLALTIVTGFAACKNSPEPIETTGAVQLLPAVATYNNNANSDTASTATVAITPAKAPSAPTKIVYIIKQPAQTAANTPAAPVNQAPAPVMAPVIPTTGSIDTATVQNPTAGNTGSKVDPVVQPVKKKGWNNATKGAVIGAGAGAIGGAILSKKKGLGAVIGGVVGAAGGYIIGKNMDKKNMAN